MYTANKRFHFYSCSVNVTITHEYLCHRDAFRAQALHLIKIAAHRSHALGSRFNCLAVLENYMIHYFHEHVFVDADKGFLTKQLALDFYLLTKLSS